jgi:hypothetical protein
MGRKLEARVTRDIKAIQMGTANANSKLSRGILKF